MDISSHQRRTTSSGSLRGGGGAGRGAGGGGGGVAGGMDMFRLRQRILLVYFQAVLIDSTGYFLAMIADGQVYFVNEGDSAILECQFHADHYNLFDYPVLWQKTQGGEETQINMMSNINEPFLETNRFEVSFVSSNAPRFKFQLRISNVTPVDSGNYTCQIRGQHSVTLGHVTNALYVRAQIQQLQVFDGESEARELHSSSSSSSPSPPPPSPRPSSSSSSVQKTFRLVEGRAARLSCVAVGGHPPPAIVVFVGERDATAQFPQSTAVALSGRRGLRSVTQRTRRATTAFLPQSTDDEAAFKCIASVPGFQPVIAEATMDVTYSPKISCLKRSAVEGERNVDVRCEIFAKPQTSNVFWIIDENGTTLSDGHETTELWSVLTDRTDGVTESQLYFTQVTPKLFRRFTIVAENVVGIATQDVELAQEFIKEPKEPLADASVGLDVIDDVIGTRNATSDVRGQAHRKKPSSSSSVGGRQRASPSHHSTSSSSSASVSNLWTTLPVTWTTLTLTLTLTSADLTFLILFVVYELGC